MVTDNKYSLDLALHFSRIKGRLNAKKNNFILFINKFIFIRTIVDWNLSLKSLDIFPSN